MDNALTEKKQTQGGGNTEHLENIDVLKFILAVIVVLRHCGQSFFSDGSLFRAVVTNTISPVAVPTFFLISGFLLWRKKVTWNRLKNHLWRIFKLYLVWTIIYLPIILLKAYIAGTFDFFDYLRRFLFDGSYFHLWYLPSLMVAVLVVYGLKKIKSRKIILTVALLLFAIGTIADTYLNFFEWMRAVVEEYRTIFLTTRNGLFFGTLFVLIGADIAERNVELNIWKITVIALFLMVCEGVLLNLFLHKIVVNMMVSSIAVASAVFLLMMNMKKVCSARTGILVRKMSTVIYCVHPIAISVAKKVSGNYSYLSVLFTMLIIAIVAYAIAKSNKFNVLM